MKDDGIKAEMRGILRTRARYDQHLATMREWFRTAPIPMKSELWNLLMSDFDHPLAEVMSEMAIVTFERLALDEYDDEREGRPLCD